LRGNSRKGRRNRPGRGHTEKYGSNRRKEEKRREGEGRGDDEGKGRLVDALCVHPNGRRRAKLVTSSPITQNTRKIDTAFLITFYQQ